MAERRVALVVATDTYDDPTLHGLAAPATDADQLGEVLGDPALGAFDVDIARNPTSWRLAERVEALFGDRRSSDLVLLHLSCHGLKNDSGELFLAARNTVPGRLASTALDAALVNKLMQRSRAHRIVLLLDCCYGGAFERGLVSRGDGDAHVGEQFTPPDLSRGRGRVVITASSALEYAFEGGEMTVGGTPQPSLFTGALVQGLRTGEADRDQDGQVSLDELYDYVYDSVTERSPHQTPSRWEFGTQGEIYVARNPRQRVVPAPLAAELVELAGHPVAGARVGAVEELAQIAEGGDLARAASAAELLRRLAEDDSRRVALAARGALDSAGLRPATTAVVLLPAVGETAAADVPLTGSPLALGSSVRSADPRVAARLEGGALRIEVTGSSVPVDTTVTLSGPLGDVAVAVTAQPRVPPQRGATAPDSEPGWSVLTDATETATRATDATATDATVTDATATETAVPAAPASPPGPGDGAERLAGLSAGLGVAGAAALAVGMTAPQEFDGVLVNQLGEATPVVLLTVLSAAAGSALLFGGRRTGPALALLAAPAAWAAAYWLRLSAQGVVLYGPARVAEVTVHTQVLAWAAAAVLLGSAVAVGARGGALGPLPRVHVGPRRVVAGLLLVAGAAIPIGNVVLQDVPSSLARTGTQWAIVLACCLPVAVAGLSAEQRTVGLLFATTFTVLSAASGVWLELAGTALPQMDYVLAGWCFTLAGCWLGQAGARRRHTVGAVAAVG